jgi:hypothetical protein
MGRAIIVLCLPRTGSSAVAGALHRMGVDMGEGHMQPADPLNERGYYEDTRWQNASKLMAGYGKSLTPPRELGAAPARIVHMALDAVGGKPIWGFKSPRAAFTLPLLLPDIQARGHDVRIVAVEREYGAVRASMKDHSDREWGGKRRLTMRGIETLLENWRIALDGTLSACDVPQYTVHYEAMLANTRPALAALEVFAFAGLEHLSNGIDEAVAWIDPALRHFQ